MNDEINEQRYLDEKESILEMCHIIIKFQDGPIKENGVNGCQIEDVITVLLLRLEGFQNGEYWCEENAMAITHLKEAQNWLYRRTRDRETRGVEGYNKK